jgi:hypothetical protein
MRNLRYDKQTRFEKLKWGAQLSEIKDIMAEKGYSLDKGSKNSANYSHSLKYRSTLLGEEVRIKLLFTPETEKLASIDIVWYDCDRNTRGLLFKILVFKYGAPTKIEKNVHKYSWERFSTSAELFDDNDYTRLTYYHNHYSSEVFIGEEMEAECGEDLHKF